MSDLYDTDIVQALALAIAACLRNIKPAATVRTCWSCYGAPRAQTERRSR